MSRRRSVVLASAAVLLGLALLVVLLSVTVTQTPWGRARLRTIASDFLNSRTQGKWHIGRIDGSLVTGFTVDSFSLSDKNDSLFIATGPIRLKFDARDIVDRRILISVASIERPYIHMREDSTGTWNFRRIFPSGPPGPPKTQPNFGDHIVLDSLALRSATFILTKRWIPDAKFTGRVRDSVIADRLTRKDIVYRRVGSGFSETWRWTNGELIAGPVRIAHPDTGGRFFRIHKLDLDESYPPFNFRNVAGTVRLLGDSLWTELPHFDLPGSTGSAAGKVWWGGRGPTHYDMRIVGDSVSLADVAWVYPTLPKVGGGKMALTIRNQRDPRIVDYALTDMDVRTVGSRLIGNMTFGVGGPLLIIKDIALQTRPIDWTLITALVGEPLPYDFRGTITGDIRARGGPLNRFVIDDASFTYDDANVPGATNVGTVKGMLDIAEPSFTIFRGFDVALDRFDLRTIRFLNPSFAELNGWISGRARLDSSWLDLRFSRADLEHHDGDTPASRFTGAGRVTFGEVDITYDLDLNTTPISFATLAKSYPVIPFRGEYSGPLRLTGKLDSLTLRTELNGAAGLMTYEGTVDGTPDTYAASGSARIENLDLRTLFDTTAFPITSLNGTSKIDIRGDSLPVLEGTISIDLGRSFVDSTRLYVAQSSLTFERGLLRVDTAYVESVAGVLAARGALGLVRDRRDSLHFTFVADSLGGLRRYLTSVVRDTVSTVGENVAPSDSLAGGIIGRGDLFGSIDSLSVIAAVDAENIYMFGNRAKRVRGRAELENVTANLSGMVSATLDTALVADIAFSSIGGDVSIRDSTSARFGILAIESSGPRARLLGDVQRSDSTTTVRFDSLTVAFSDRVWALERNGRIIISESGTTIEPIVLGAGERSQLSVEGSVPLTGPVDLTIRMDSLSLIRLGELAQLSIPLGGDLSMLVRITGTRADPLIDINGGLLGATFGGVRVTRAALKGNYAARRLDGSLDVFNGDSVALAARFSLPVDLALEARANRLLGDSLSGSLSSQSVDLSLIESFSPTLRAASGELRANMRLAGTWKHPHLNGEFTVKEGAVSLISLGAIRWRNLNIDLRAMEDSLILRRFSVQSGRTSDDTLSLTGSLILSEGRDPTVNLRLATRFFHVIDKPRTADVTLTSDIGLTGPVNGATLSGRAILDRAEIYIRDFSDKQVISLDDPELFNVVDTTLYANRTLIPQTSPPFVRNLRVRDFDVVMGPEVRIISSEANIKLGGSVQVTVARPTRDPSADPQLALDGTLFTERGTYRLNLGIVQRTFQVERGEVRFLGDPDLNPDLDISAVYTVRQISGNNARNDTRIRVRLEGTLANPRLRLQSADSLAISESDLVSYLVTGQPSFDIGGPNRFRTTAQRVLFGSVSSWLGSAIGGNVFDMVQVQTASDAIGSKQEAGVGLFTGATLGVGKQITERTFISLNAGLCRLQSLLGGTPGEGITPSLTDLIGFKIEHRFDRGFGASIGLEPPTSALFCTNLSRSAFAPTPKQWGFDLFRAWRF